MIFDELIQPLSNTIFWSEFYEKKHYVINRNDNHFYDNIMSTNSLNEYFNSHNLSYPDIRLIKQGVNLASELYVIDKQSNKINKKVLFKYYAEGATIRLQKAHNLFDSLYHFCNSLSRELQMSIMANMYITPNNSYGFNPHYDTHDVLVLQLDGVKHWNIYDIPILLPLETQKMSLDNKKKYKEEKPIFTIPLCAGDLLYIPRGMVHDAYTLTNSSTHITIGLHPKRNIDILTDVIKISEQNLEFRKTFKNSIAENLALKNELIQLIEKLFEELPKNNYGNLSYKNTFSSIESINKLDDKTLLKLNKNEIIDIETIDSLTKIYTCNGHITLPFESRQAFLFMQSNDVFTFDELLYFMDKEIATNLCKQFVLDGLLQVSN